MSIKIKWYTQKKKMLRENDKRHHGEIAVKVE